MENLTIIAGRWNLNRWERKNRSNGAPSKRCLTFVSVFCLMAVALAGCHGGRSRSPNDRQAVSILFSPNAEPLSGGPLGHPKCEEALSAWFDRIDANHDGIVDRGEFLADSRQQFDRMDLHHAGYVTAVDLSEYRAPYESASGAADRSPPPDRQQDEQSPAEKALERQRLGGNPGEEGGRGSQQRGPSVDTRADPVMSADKTLSFKVTLADFMAQANDIFNGLDHNRDGRVTRDMVIAICPVIKK